MRSSNPIGSSPEIKTKTSSLARLRLIKYSVCDGATNMAIDEAIFLACQENRSEPTLRFYGWSPPAVSIGYGQKAAEAVDLKRCAALGIDMVRRPTGGMAVLHSGDLSYCLVVPSRARPFDGGIRESYRWAGECFARGLQSIGVEVEIAEGKTGRDETDPDLAAFCFSSLSAYEVCHRGKKLIGSSQKRRGGAILQHGSIFLEADWDRIAEIARPPGNDRRARAVSRLKEKMTSLGEIGLADRSPGRVAAALARGFEDLLGVELIGCDLTPYELELAARLRDDKYSSAAWRLAR